MTHQPTFANWLSIAFLGVVWGGTFMVVALALQGYGPITVAAARTTLGAVALMGLALAMGRSIPFGRQIWSHIVPIGVLSTALPFALLSWGQQHVPSAFAGLSMAALPLIVLPLAHFFTDEQMSLRKTVGMCIGFLGALVLIGPSLMQLGLSASEPLGQMACIGAALCYGVASILTRRCPPIDPIVLGALSLVVGSGFLLPLMIVTEGIPRWQSGTPGLAIVFLGLVPTAIGAILRVVVIRSAGPVFMTLVNYQVPVWSMVFGALILSEALPLRFFLALVLILGGLAISQWSSLRALARA